MAEIYNVWLKKLNCLDTVKMFWVICPWPRAMCMYKIIKSLNVSISETSWTSFIRIHMEPSVDMDVDNLVKWFRAIEQDG